MRKLFVLFLLTLGFISCNDGDIITTELEFGDTFEACGDLVLYKTKTAPNESLSLQITSPSITIESLLQTDIDPSYPLLEVLVATESAEIAIGTTNPLNFRSYTNPPVNLFCNDVPPTNILVTEDFYSESGIAQFTMELLEDDNDGIPAELEDINGNGNLYDDDTDGDGLPNFADIDDDGDNVLTTSEGVNYTEGMTLSELNLASLNTDVNSTTGDNIPNYLDNDDDGDGDLTINEDANGNLNPTDDSSTPGIADYLNDMDSGVNVVTDAYRDHSVSQTFTVKLILQGIQFPTISYQTLDFGTLDDASVSGNRIIEVPFD